MASAGSMADPVGSKPLRFMYNCPSGNRSRIWCAQCTARAVLPTPARQGHAERSLLGRITAYAEHALAGCGGVVVQQSTEDADAEVWNLVYSDPNVQPLLESGRLAFELKVGQGAKPGLAEVPGTV